MNWFVRSIAAAGLFASACGEAPAAAPSGDETVSGAAVMALGLDYLDGDVTGMTPPSSVNGVIAEGTPFVGVVYFGRKSVPGTPEVRRYSCVVPEQFRFDHSGRKTADKSRWICRKTDGRA